MKKNKLQYICVQPYTVYYSWQVDVMLYNFIEMGISESDIHILLSYDSEVDTKTYYVWNKVIEKHKGVNFYFYPDLRVSKNYVSSIRPNVLSQFYKENPKFSKLPVFYHDCDILFTNSINYSHLLDDDVWYLSDTHSYISSDYIISKVHDIYEKMCDIMDMDLDIPKKYDKDSGGAQYILKNVDWSFWEKVESDSEKLFTEITSYNTQLKNEYPNYHELQIWCADMWALLWNAWKAGHETKVVEEMNFSWATSLINEWDKNPIYHNAGVVSNSEMFFKSDYQEKLPYNLDLSKLNKSYCSYNYAEEILKQKNK
jgi:hypothetical protein